MPDNVDQPEKPMSLFKVVDLNYFSLYYEDFQEAIAFYEKVFGPPENADEEGSIFGWRMGSTWLTLFPSKGGTKAGSNPQNTEFAIQVSTPEEVDALYEALIAAGGKKGWEPFDTSMYEEMRFAYINDPFGVRIDIYCLLPEKL
jgi:uncharacterized glyoxalase superfamily protein PhnB